MARLTETEKIALLHSRSAGPLKQPRPPLMSHRAYLAFTTFAAHFTRARKPVNFSGNHWKL